MIVEERTYTLASGKLGEYLALYEAEGLEIQGRALGNLVGYFSTEIGTLNQVVHLWGYENLEERARRRRELQADPAWGAYLGKIRPMVVAAKNRILAPAPFSPIGGCRPWKG